MTTPMDHERVLLSNDRREDLIAAYAFINDSHGSVNSEYLSALSVYGIKPTTWSKSENEVSSLS